MAGFAARTTDLVVEELDGGLVIYDTRSDRAHYLDAATTAVWRACAAPHTLDQLVTTTGLPAEACRSALDQLGASALLETPGGVSRRTVLATVAKLSVAGAAAAPILSAVIPAAAAAASTGTGPGGGGEGSPCPPGTPCANPDPLQSGTTPTTVQIPGSPTPVVAGSYTNGAYSVIPNTTYIGPPTNDGSPSGDYTYTVGTPIVVPCSAYSATLTVEFFSDNQGTALINGTSIGQNAPGDNPCQQFQGSVKHPCAGQPETVTADLTPGESYTLSFVVNNAGPGPTALDYLATLSLICPA